MAEETPVDYSQIYDFLYRIERRIGYLEKDAIFIERKIKALEENRSNDFKTLIADLDALRVNISSLKNNLTQCGHGMARLGKDMRNSVKKEDLMGLNAQLDEVKFEEYVTSRDLKHGL